VGGFAAVKQALNRNCSPANILGGLPDSARCSGGGTFLRAYNFP
jgi:hypothetical protein